MVRIILEDIKLNKKKEPLSSKKEAFVLQKKFPTFNNFKEETKKPLTTNNIIDGKDEEDIVEEKIVLEKETPFNNRFSHKQRITRTPKVREKGRIISRYIFLIFILSILVGVVYWGGNYFQKADVTLTRKHQLINYNNKPFLASKDSSANAVDFEIMIIPDTKTKNLILTEPKDVSIKATGVVTLYNEFGTNPQKLLAGTFLSDNNGKAYKTDSVVTIPGYKLDSNKKIIPGQMDVNITAFLAGDTYNGSPSDFYITSFKGTTKYSKIYGKLKKTIEGGASGVVYVLNDKDKNSFEEIAQSSFKNDLFSKVKAQVPPGYILYPNASTFSYKINENYFSKTPEAEVTIEGTMSVVLLREKSLIDNIMRISLPGIKGNELKEITIPQLSNLSFSFANDNQSITKEVDSISFKLNGQLDAIWTPDVEILKNKLAGTNKDNVLPIFRQDPGISSAIVNIFPPWQKYIPEDKSKINIIID